MHRQIAGKLTGPVSKWIVLVASILVVMALGPFAGKLTEVQNNEAQSWLPASAESTRALDKLAPFQDPNTIPTVVVYERKSGLTAADLAAARADVADFQKMKGVEGTVVGPLPSQDGQAAQTLINFNLGKDGWNKMPDVVDDLKDTAKAAGLSVHVTGAGGQAADAVEAFGGLDTSLLFWAMIAVFLILLIVYRSAFLWVLPILSAFVALGTSMGLVYFLAKDAGLTVNGQSQAILSILVIGAGTDYALLLVARYREELRRHENRHEAMAYALHRAAPAILASAATVALGLLVLMLAEMNSTAGMGPVVAIGVVVTFVVMVTFLPALLVICGRWVFGPQHGQHRRWAVTGASMLVGGIALAGLGGGVLGKLGGAIGVGGTVLGSIAGLAAFFGLLMLLQVGLEHWTGVHGRPDFGSREPMESGLWARVGARVAVRPRVVWIGTAAVLALACLGVLRINANGMPSDETYTKEFDSLTGMKVLARHGLVDESNTVMVVANAAKGAEVAKAMSDIDGLKPPAAPPVVKDGVAFLQAVIQHDVSSQAAFDVVEATRSAVHAVDGADGLVGGGSAFYLDTKTASQRDDKVIIPVILVVVLLVLMLLLRAIAAPLLLLGTVVLSFGAAMGLSWLLFEFVFGFDAADPGYPLFAFVFLVALGIDYNIFLMTRVREEAMVHGTRRGALVGLTSTGGVITSAGLVLAATFLILGSLPLVFLVELGVTVALGVMIDTLIVRSVLVTALNLDLGAKIWWPWNPEPQGVGGGAEPERELAGV